MCDTLRIAVFGPGMETRSLPEWALAPVDASNLTEIEAKVLEIGKKKYGKRSVVIEGPPWVNPMGRGKRFTVVGRYISEPIQLSRALAVAFCGGARSVPLDGALVAVDSSLLQSLHNARDLVVPKLPINVLARVVWWAFEPDVENGLRSEAFVKALGPLFQ